MASVKNARLATLIAFLSDLAFILPIWLLFGTNELGLSTTTTTVLFMTVWLGSGLLEVPTGALADRLGRKKMFLIGASLLTLYPIVYILEASILQIFVVSLLAALGSALRSGVLVALTHDSYKQDGRSEREYHAFLSNQQTAAFIARAISGVAGGLLYAYNPQAPYVAILLTYIAIVIAGAFIMDTADYSEQRSNRAHIAETARLMWQKQLIVLLVVSYVAFQFVGEAMWTAYQPFYESDGRSPAVIGGLFSIIAILSALGSYSTRYLMRRWSVLRIELFVCLSILITSLLLFVPNRDVRLLAIIPSGFMFGVAITPIVATAQKHIASKYHSTALSIINLAQYATYGVASIYVGIIIDRFGVEQTRKILLVEAILITLLLSIVYLKKRHTDEVVSEPA